MCDIYIYMDCAAVVFAVEQRTEGALSINRGGGTLQASQPDKRPPRSSSAPDIALYALPYLTVMLCINPTLKVSRISHVP